MTDKSTPAVETELEKVPEEARQRAERQVASLNAYGYTEVTEAGSLSVGQRVHHVGERYPGASRGTATIERIFTRAGGHDVEVIVRREKPDSTGDTYGFWANYHTIPVRSLAGQP